MAGHELSGCQHTAPEGRFVAWAARRDAITFAAGPAAPVAGRCSLFLARQESGGKVLVAGPDRLLPASSWHTSVTFLCAFIKAVNSGTPEGQHQCNVLHFCISDGHALPS